MAHYDYRCDTCEAVFEECRPMAAADAPARCPDGHVGATRLLPFSPWADARICVLRGSVARRSPAAAVGRAPAPVETAPVGPGQRRCRTEPH